MRKLATSIAALLLMGLMNVASTKAQDAGYQPTVGRQHPQIVLPRIDTRQPVALSQFRGRKVLLIHFASW